MPPYLYSPTDPFGKDNWLPGCISQFLTTPGTFFRMVDDIAPERIEGRNAYFKVRIKRSLGQGTTPQGGAFPAPIDPGYAEGKLPMSRLSHTIELSFDEWEMLNSRNAAAVPVVEEKMGEAVKTMAWDIGRQQY